MTPSTDSSKELVGCFSPSAPVRVRMGPNNSDSFAPPKQEIDDIFHQVDPLLGPDRKLVPPSPTKPVAATPVLQIPFDGYKAPLLQPQELDGELYGLPTGWIIELRPRTAPGYVGKVDQFYYEPLGGNKWKQFRSLKSVERYLGVDLSLVTARLRAAGPIKPKLETAVPYDDQAADDRIHEDPAAWSFDSNPPADGRKKKKLDFDFDNAPESVTWELSNAGTDEWTARIGEDRVPEEIQKLWEDRFLSTNNAQGNSINGNAGGRAPPCP